MILNNKSITKVLTVDMLSDESKYTKDGMVIFDEIVFKENNGEVEISLYNNGIKLIKLISNYYFYASVHFNIQEGQMKIEVN